MGQNRKNYNLPNLAEADWEYLQNIKETGRLSMREAFAKLVADHKTAGTGTPNPDLVTENTRLTLENTALEAKVLNFTEKLNEQTALITELNTRLQQLAEMPAAPEPVKAPNFIYNPTPELFRSMQRAIVYLHKEGKINRGDANLPQTFTTKAINYYIKNAFPSGVNK